MGLGQLRQPVNVAQQISDSHGRNTDNEDLVDEQEQDPVIDQDLQDSIQMQQDELAQVNSASNHRHQLPINNNQIFMSQQNQYRMQSRNRNAPNQQQLLLSQQNSENLLSVSHQLAKRTWAPSTKPTISLSTMDSITILASQGRHLANFTWAQPIGMSKVGLLEV